jgi:hypothetical protein
MDHVLLVIQRCSIWSQTSYVTDVSSTVTVSTGLWPSAGSVGDLIFFLSFSLEKLLVERNTTSTFYGTINVSFVPLLEVP